MAATLRRVERVIAAMDTELGPIAEGDFAAFALRAARALGCKHGDPFACTDGQRAASYDDMSLAWGGYSYLTAVIAGAIKAWRYAA